MPTPVLVGHRKYNFYQTNVTNEANTDAGATWTASEVTLLTSLRTKINSTLAAMRSAGIIATTTNVKYGTIWGGKAAKFGQANITDVPAGTFDITYGLADEGNAINNCKTAINSMIAALNAAGFGGSDRYRWTGYLRPRQKVIYNLTAAPITLADADGTYTSGASGEQALVNTIKARLNSILDALRAAKVITT